MFTPTIHANGNSDGLHGQLEIDMLSTTGPDGSKASYLRVKEVGTGRCLLDRGFVAVRYRAESIHEADDGTEVSGQFIEWRSDVDLEPPELEICADGELEGDGKRRKWVIRWPLAARGLMAVTAIIEAAADAVLCLTVEVSPGPRGKTESPPISRTAIEIEEVTVLGIAAGEGRLILLGDKLDLRAFAGPNEPVPGDEKTIIFANGWQSWSRSGAAASAAEILPASGRGVPEGLFDSETLRQQAEAHVSMHNGWRYLETLTTAASAAAASGSGSGGGVSSIGALLAREVSGPVTSEGFACFADTNGSDCTLIGFTSSARYMGFVEVGADSGGPANIRAVLPAERARLENGGKFVAEPLVLVFVLREGKGVGGDPNDSARMALQIYASLVAEQARTMAPARIAKNAPVGWCSWYYYYNTISEEDILENTSYLKKSLAARPGSGLPVRYVQVDDGYQKGIGDWLESNEKFPHGMAWLARQIRAAGFIPGIWVAPFAVAESSELARTHPDWLLRDAAGEPVLATHNWGEMVFGLDCSHPGVREWLRALVRTIAGEWGYSYLKIDFIYAAALPARHYDPSWTRAAAYREGVRIIGETLAEVAPPDEAYLLGCGAPLLPSVGLVDGMRVSADVAPTFWPLVANVGYPSLFEALRGTLTRQFMHCAWWQNDPDCLIVRDTDTELTAAEVRALATVGALAGGVTFSSDRLTALSAERLELLRRAMKLSLELSESPPAVVVDPLSRPFPSVIIRRRTARCGGRVSDAWLVALFNWKESAETCSLRVRDLGLADDSEVEARDWWAGTEYGRARGEVIAEAVEPHGVRLLELRPVAAIQS